MRSVVSICWWRGVFLSPWLLLPTFLLPALAFGQPLDAAVTNPPAAQVAAVVPAVTPGTYSGLFYEASQVAQGHSGCITVTVTPSRQFTGCLLLGKERYIGQGQFAPATPLTTSLWRHGRKLLVVTLEGNLEPGGEGLLGSISSGLWTAEVWANRAVFDAKTNPAPYAGTYTLVIPGPESNPAQPTGDGCGSLKVDAAGNVTFTGTLADGTVLAQKAPLSRQGAWPFYASLYGGKGSVLSWLCFTNQPTDDVHGALSWIRPPSPRHKPFSGRFTSDIFQAAGSRYIAPVGTPLLLNLTNGAVVFSGPTPWGAPFTNALSLGSPDNASSARVASSTLALALRLPTGAFSGSVALPGASTRVPFKGVVLQKQNAGAGYFLRHGQSGRVYLGARPED